MIGDKGDRSQLIIGKSDMNGLDETEEKSANDMMTAQGRK